MWPLLAVAVLYIQGKIICTIH